MNTHLTRATISLIKQAIEISGSTNSYVLCETICDILQERHGSDNASKKLEYQVARMNLDSTKKIMEAIDVYFYKYIRYENKL